MTKAWSEVASSDGFKSLPPDQQDSARRQYFDQVVSPRVPPDQVDMAWDQFSTDTGVGRRSLPAGVKPSTAGAGRGSVNPTLRTAQPDDIDLTGNPQGFGSQAIEMPAARRGGTSVIEARQGFLEPGTNTDPDGTPAPRTLPTMRPSDGIAQPDRANDIGLGLKYAPLPVRAAAKAVSGIAQGAGGTLRAAGDVAGIDFLSNKGARLNEIGNQFDQGMGTTQSVEGFGPKSPVPYLSNMAEGATSSLAQSAAMASTMGARAVIPMMSIMTAGQEYDQARNSGLDPAAALAGAIPKGVFEAVGEKFSGLDKVAASMGTLLTKGASVEAKRQAANVLVKSGIKEIPGEVVTYLGQTGVDLLPGIGLNPELTMGQFLDGLKDTVVQAGMMGGAMGATGAHVAKSTTAEPDAQALAKSKGFLVQEQRIKTLRDAGETAAADLLQAKHDKQVTLESIDGELQKMPGNPVFQQTYRDYRTAGIKPAEAAARSAVTTSYQSLVETAGIPEKAAALALEQAKDMPLDKIPGFFQKFTEGLAKRGLVQPFDGMTELGTDLETARDDAMEMAVTAHYEPNDVRSTMDAAQALESDQNTDLAPVDNAQAATETVADKSTPLTRGGDIARTIGQQIDQTDGNRARLYQVEADRIRQAGEAMADTPDVAQSYRDAADILEGQGKLLAEQELNVAAHDAATSPLNNLPEPTQAQKEAGNYKVGRVNLHGLNISIENPEGSTRSGTSPDGTKWENTMAAHYGYIRGSEGNDGDQVDVFIGPNPESTKVFVIDQVNKDGSYDEHKVMLGTDSLQQADDLYHANYHAGWTGRGAITEMSMDDFKKWVRDGVKNKPLARLETASPYAATKAADAAPAVQPTTGSAVDPVVSAEQSDRALKDEQRKTIDLKKRQSVLKSLIKCLS